MQPGLFVTVTVGLDVGVPAPGVLLAVAVGWGDGHRIGPALRQRPRG